MQGVMASQRILRILGLRLLLPIAVSVYKHTRLHVTSG